MEDYPRLVRYYIVECGVVVVEDCLHEPCPDFGYAVNIGVYAEAQDRSL